VQAVRPLRSWPAAARHRLTRLTRRPPVGHVRFGSLRRVTPISDTFGYDRGLPIDRYYIELFLQEHSGTIRGNVLEVGDSTYTTQLVSDETAERVDILDVGEANRRASIVVDLHEPDRSRAAAANSVLCSQA